MGEFARRAQVFGQRLSQQFNSTASFFDALLGAGAGMAFEAAQTVIEKVDPPPGYEEDHQRVLRSLDEAVRLDREVGRSIDEQDIVLFAVSNIGLARNGGLTALDVAPSVCAGLGFDPSLCRVPDEIPGGEYGALLYPAMREFRARFGTDGGLQGQLNLFTFISDDELFGLVAAAVPDMNAIAMDVRDGERAGASQRHGSGPRAAVAVFRVDAQHATGYRGRGGRLGPRCRAQRQPRSGYPACWDTRGPLGRVRADRRCAFPGTLSGRGCAQAGEGAGVQSSCSGSALRASM